MQLASGSRRLETDIGEQAMSNNAASNKIDIRGSDLPAPTQQVAQVTQGPLASPQGESLIASLTRIQRGDPSAPTGGNPALATSLATPRTANVLRELRGTSLGSSLGHVDSAMLDIVAMLFDQIFAREEIPPRMKALIGRLQIPILKVAILDNSFLA